MKHWLSPQEQYNYLSWLVLPAGFFAIGFVGILYFTGVTQMVWAGLALLWTVLCQIVLWHLRCPHCRTLLRWGPRRILARRHQYVVPAVCIRCKGRLDNRDYEGRTLEWSGPPPGQNEEDPNAP